MQAFDVLGDIVAIVGREFGQNGTAEGDELDVLATLVDAYEREHLSIDAPDPVDAITFRLE